MTKKYFKCTLLSDLVINASLKTEGNMETLDYIPGSKLLGIVAGDDRYKTFRDKDKDLSYDLFHSGKVSFGDAHIAVSDAVSYAMPFSLFTEKSNPKPAGEGAKVWVHHAAKPDVLRVQQRSGYLTAKGEYIPRVKKRFALKSAYDRETRKSKNEAMFGFESIQAGQQFIFRVDFEDEQYVEAVTEALLGAKRLGKSKTAQYGQIKIEPLNEEELSICNSDNKPQGKRLVIYAESNLCFFNEFGQASFQPAPKDFGLEGKGRINWDVSQIRTYSYSPWNSFRGTTDTQRDVILKGSVIVFEFDEGVEAEIPASSKVGAYRAEGLGRVIYEPEFLQAGADGLWQYQQLTEIRDTIRKEKTENAATAVSDTALSAFLQQKKEQLDREWSIGQAVSQFISSAKQNFGHITSSQWGRVREKASQYKEFDDLYAALFGENGMLCKGVSAQKYWDKKNGVARKKLEEAIVKNKKLGSLYVAKISSEMAKLKQNANSNRNGK